MKKSALLRLPAGPRRPVKRPKKGRALAIRRLRRHPNRALAEAEIRNLLFAIEDNRDDALIRLGLSVGLRVSEVVTIRTSEIDFERGLVKIWDEKKDRWRLVMPTKETISAIKKYLNSLPKQPQYLFPLSTKTVERIIQKHSKKALGFVISWHSLRTTYVSRSVELEQSPAVVMANTGDSPATILKYYTKLPEVVMRRFVEGKPVIPSERV
jgi:integrase/recombinase XerD